MTTGQRLFTEFELRGRRLPNRIVSTPHATGWGRDGLIAPEEVDYHVRKAAGGCGLVMTFGSASVDPSSAASYGSVSLWDERNEPALRALAQGVHEHGAFCISQMTHMGRRGDSRVSEVVLRSASDWPEGVHREVPVAMTRAEIAEAVERFAQAALRLRRCGWDGAEITSFGGHLIEQFFDPDTNDRTDGYGGSLENRARLGREVVQAVRAAAGDDFIVSFRMTLDQQSLGGMGTDALIEVARAINVSQAIDVFSLSGGSGTSRLATGYFVAPAHLPEAAFAEPACAFRRTLDVPVLVAGRILNRAAAERCLAAGIDLVAMTRAIIADPELPRKLQHALAPRPCISINEGCIGRLYGGIPMGCSINPAVRSVDLDNLEPAATTLRVTVIGGGVSGLAAARAAAVRGHDVRLLERDAGLGGRVAKAARYSAADRWPLYVQWLEDEIGDAGVTVQTGTQASASDVLTGEPDVVIVATRSRLRQSCVPPGPIRVAALEELLDAPPGAPPTSAGHAIVVDDAGDLSTAAAIELLVSDGWAVEVVTTEPSVLFGLDLTQLPFVLREAARSGVRLTPNSEVVRSEPGARVVLRDVYAGVTAPRSDVGLIVLSGFRQAENELADELSHSWPEGELHVVGDALAPRRLMDAVREGTRAGATCG
jgi:dimethylglycine catabolism A